MMEEDVTWLMGREGGIGFAGLNGELLMVLGSPGRLESATYLLGPRAVDEMDAILDRFRSTGRPGGELPMPDVGWDGDFPSL